MLGGAYLAYLGVQSLRAGRNRASLGEGEAAEPRTRLRADFLAGLMTNLSNPKALIFFGALLVRFVPAGGGVVAQVEVWALMTAMACVWFCALSLLVSRPAFRRALAEWMHKVNYVTGTVFLLLGAAMLWEGLAPG